MKNSGELKKRCWLAKQRLKMGYWDSVKARDDGQVQPFDAEKVQPVRVMSRESEVAAIALSAADEKMYKKVCDMLGGSEVTLNPIGQLIERDVYDGLDPVGKQRYILELSDKFRELQDRYRRENAGA